MCERMKGGSQPMYMSVCVRMEEMERVCVCVAVRERERRRERERERL